MAKTAKAERKSTASASDDAVAHLQAVIDNIMDAIITIDELGVIESFNPAAERMFSYPSKEVIGENVKMLMPEHFSVEHDGYLRNYRETGEAKIIGIGREVTGRRKDGTEFPADLAVTEMRVGERLKFVGIIRDFSERKHSEQLIAQQSQALMELSTPVIPILNDVIMLPLIGVIDSARAQQIIENLLDAVVENEAAVVIIDLTGVPIMDTAIAQHILQTVSATEMLGAKVIITGISPEISQTLVKLKVDFFRIRTRGSLAAGLVDALSLVGKRVVSNEGDGK